MSYVDQSHLNGPSRAMGMGASLTLVGGVLLGMLTLAPIIVPGPDTDTLTTYPVPVDPVPPPEPQPKPEPKAKPEAKLAPSPPPRPVEPLVATPQPPAGPSLVPIEVSPGTGVGPGTGTGTTVAEPPAPPAPFVEAEIDPRYAADFQPDYPASELRADREGVVVLRIRIGVDGRVKSVEQVSATSSAFFEAARRHALARWRFRPATSGGIPVETDRRMTLRFRITDR